MVLRRQFGPKEEEVTGDWRKLRNEELHGLCLRFIIQVNKSRRTRGVGHVEIWGGAYITFGGEISRKEATWKT
jgi:hypothetical protein